MLNRTNPRKRSGWADEELGAAYELQGLVKHWLSEQQPPELKLAKELRDRRGACCRMLCGLDPKTMPSGQFQRLHLGNGSSDAALKPYKRDAPESIVGRHMFSDRIGAKLDNRSA